MPAQTEWGNCRGSRWGRQSCTEIVTAVVYWKHLFSFPLWSEVRRRGIDLCQPALNIICKKKMNWTLQKRARSRGCWRSREDCGVGDSRVGSVCKMCRGSVAGLCPAALRGWHSQGWPCAGAAASVGLAIWPARPLDHLLILYHGWSDWKKRCRNQASFWQWLFSPRSSAGLRDWPLYSIN